ncbi:MAG: FRG domain-containing protein [Chloroflexi bacterium]|nr:FRG domain-containing protein [Chloroflexota bacterium]MCC6891586.1 FRG domain-containing protein [Anaerolineae bacterium]
MSMDSFLETKDCTSAVEFLEYLQLRNPRWLPPNTTEVPWVFRGQRDASWPLLPSALRPDDKKPRWQLEWFKQFRDKERSKFEQFLNNEYRNAIKTLDLDITRAVDLLLQVGAEIKIVEDFIILADKVGHPIPQNAQPEKVRRPYSSSSLMFEVGIHEMNQVKEFAFKPHSIEQALAQHHGIPTRALDWSFASYVGAFFAAEEYVLNKTQGSDLMAVWAIKYTELNEQSNLEVITQPRAQISYLNAQSGLFIYDKTANRHFLENGQWRTFKEALQSPNYSGPILRNVTLPVSEAHELLRLLSAENITRSHLMPSFDSIAKTVELNSLIAAAKL